MFTGLIKCPECGRLLGSTFTTNSVGTEYRGYRCQGVTVKQCSYTTYSSEGKLERYLLANLPQLIADEIKDAEALAMERIEIEKATPKKNIKTDVAKLKEKLRKLSIVYVDGLIDDEEYLARSTELKTLIDQASQETPQAERDITYLKEVLKTDWRALYEDMTLENKRRWWRGLIKEIIVEGSTVKKVIFL